MSENCPECARLWAGYIEARREYAAAWRGLETSPADKAAIERAQAAFTAREQVRSELAGHQAAAHKQ